MVVGFSTSGALISWLIRRVTNSPTSHAYFRFALFGREVVFQSDYRGVGIEDWERFKRSNRIVAEFEVNLPFDSLMPEMIAALGSRYDFAGILGQLWVFVGAFFGKAWSNSLQKDDRWYCSEMAAHFLKEAGEADIADPSVVSPAALYAILKRAR